MDRQDLFTRSDSTTTINPPTDGLSDWVIDQGTWGISSNRGYPVTQGDFDMIRLDMSSNDQFNAVFLSTVQGGQGVIARASSPSDFYLVRYYDADQSFTLYSVVSGVYTLISSVTRTVVSGDIIGISVQGTTIECYHNGATPIGPLTDLSIAAGSYAGLWYFSTGGGAGSPRFDQFDCVDLAGPVAALNTRRPLLGVGR